MMVHTELRLNMHILMDELEAYNPVAYIDDILEMNLSQVRKFRPGSDNLSEKTVYVTDYATASSIENTQLRLNIICPDRGDFETSFNDNLNIISLNSSLAIEDLVNILQDIFEKYYQWNQSILDIIMNNGSKDEVLDIAAEMLKNPIVLFDYSLKPVTNAEENPEQYDGTIWQQVMNLGYSLLENYSDEHKKKFFNNLNNNKKPFLYKNDQADNYTQLFVNLYIDGTRIGSLGLIDRNCPFSTGQISLVYHLKNLMEAELNHNEKIYYSLDHNLLFEKMLRGYYVADKMVQYHLKKLNWKIDDSFFIIVFSNVIRDFPDAHKSYRFRIGQFFKYSVTIPFNEDLVTLIKTDNDSLTQLSTYNDFTQFVKRIGFKCGVSMKFDNFLNLKYYYRQSVSAIREGANKDSAGACYFYKDYFLEDLVHSLEKDTNLQSLCHPQLLILKKNDETSGSEYVKTLYYYLLYGRNMTDAADKLFIHRNTLTYRLSKINELVNIDMNDNELLFHLLTSCRLVEFL